MLGLTFSSEISSSSSLTLSNALLRTAAPLKPLAIPAILMRNLLMQEKERLQEKERSIKKIEESEESIIDTLRSSLEKISNEEFKSLVKLLAFVPMASLNKIFSQENDFSYSLLSSISSAQLLRIFKTLSKNKINLLLQQIPEEKRSALFSQKFSNQPFLNIVCSCDDKELMDLILSYFPKETIKETLLNTYSFSFLYAIGENYDQAAFSIIAYAKQKGYEDYLNILLDKIESTAQLQHLFTKGKTSLIIAILDSLKPEEQKKLLFIEKEPIKKQPLGLALLNKQIDTFKQVLDLVPESLFFTYTNGENLLHFVCLNDLNDLNKEILDCINAHLIANKYNEEQSWKKLLSKKDNFNNTPIENLALKKTENEKTIPLLEKLETFLSVESFTNLVLKSNLVLLSLFHAHFTVASYLISKNPQVTCFIRSENDQNLLHCLASSQDDLSFKEEERVNFLEKHLTLFKDQLKILINQLDKFGNTPLSNARLNDFERLQKYFMSIGADPKLTNDIQCSKLLAHSYSIKGNLPYPLEGWNFPSALKEMYKSLKDLPSSFSVPEDLIEIFKILTLPEEKQRAEIERRAKLGLMWIKPISVGHDSTHAITMIGFSKLTILCNTMPYFVLKGRIETEVPASMQPLMPLSESSINRIFRLREFDYPSEHHLLVALTSYFKKLSAYPIIHQEVGNCIYSSIEGSIFAYLALSKIQENIKEITEESIHKILDEVYPEYVKLKDGIRELHLKKYRGINKDLDAAIDSITLLRYANRLINKKENSIKALISETPDSNLSALKPLNELSEEERGVYIEVSLTQKRLDLLRLLFSLNNDKFNDLLKAYVIKKELRSLISEESPRTLSFLEK